MLVANALDPQYKLRFIPFFYETLYNESKGVEATEIVTNELHKMFEIYESHSTPRKASNVVGECSEGKKIKKEEERGEDRKGRENGGRSVEIDDKEEGKTTPLMKKALRRKKLTAEG
ncbi:hypothetical protein ACLOJK_041383 [Asimina triloba]